MHSQRQIAQPPQPTRLLTGAEVCALLSVSPSWLGRHRDRLDPVAIPGRGRNGREYRYPVAKVEAFIARGREEVCRADDSFEGKSMEDIIQIIRLRRGSLIE